MKMISRIVAVGALGLLSACGSPGGTRNSVVDNASGHSAASSASAPTAEQGPSLFLAQLLVGTAFQMHLRSRQGSDADVDAVVQKTDGQPITLAGGEGYRLFVKARMFLPHGFRPECDQGRPICVQNVGLQFSRYPMHVTYDGNIEFAKTEQGWRLQAINIDFDQPSSVEITTPPPPDNRPLAGTWHIDMQSIALVGEPKYTETLTLTVSGDSFSGTSAKGDPVTGKIGENDVITLNQQPPDNSIVYQGQIDRKTKTITGTWMAGLGNHGPFTAKRIR